VSNSGNPTVEVRIPTILRPYTGGAKVVSAQGSTLRDVISDLDVRFIGGLDLALKDGDSITILPAVAGGC
jgi:molybdopterin converting factor small subunit